MNYLRILLLKVYAWSLYTYPKHFRTQFGDELQETFKSLLDEAGECDWSGVLYVGWRELWQYPRNLIREYRHAFEQHWKQASQRDLNKIRWMTRGLSLFVLWFLLTVVQQGVTRYEPRFVPFMLMSAITALCLSVAWCREYIGGWLTVQTSLSMGAALFIIAFTIQDTAYNYLLHYLGLYLLYIVPSLITGILFMSVGKAGQYPRLLA